MNSSRTWLCLAAVLALAVVPAAGQDGKQEAPRPKTLEEQKREALMRGYEAALKGSDVRVTIEARNATVQDVVEQFRRQVVGWNFLPDYINFADDYRIDEFIVRDVAWRDAFEAFLAKTGMVIDDEKPGIIRFSKPARVTFALKDADIKSVVDLIARISRANIILSPDVKGTITLSVNDVPWNVVLETTVKTLGDYVVVRERFDILRIVHSEELKKQMETRTYPLKFLTPPPQYRARTKETPVISGRAPTPATTIEQIKKEFTLLTMLQGMLTRKGDAGAVLGRMDYDVASNSITVTDTKVVLDKMGKIIELLDKEPEQVLIDVKFVSTSNEELLNFGINYTLDPDEGIKVSTQLLPPVRLEAPGTAPGTITEAPFTASGFGKLTRLPFGFGREEPTSDHFFLTSYDMLATFRAFRKDRFSKLIQEPTIGVVDNAEATIFVGETISYAEVRTATNQFGGIDFTVAEGQNSPVKIGFQLLVIPRIVRQENKVLLTVIPQNEFLSGTSTQAQVAGFEHFELGSPGGAGANISIDLPRISSTTLVTRVLLESGRTAVLGGLVTERITYEDKKIPILGDIPLINFLFKQRNDRVTRDHLLIFITPRIVRSARESEQNLRSQLRELEKLEREHLESLRMEKARVEMQRLRDEQQRKGAAEVKDLQQPK